jgi:hypothetical protein
MLLMIFFGENNFMFKSEEIIDPFWKMIPNKNGDGNNYTKSYSKLKINVHHPRDNTKGI